jgi:hypothetical protein
MNTYYVSPAGNDLSSGSQTGPFKTIGKASSLAVAGDTIHITAGIYCETIAPNVDGVTYNGERGPNGEWLTIIDPSQPVPPNSWRRAPDIGTNVWQADLRYRPGIFTYNGQCIECLGDTPEMDFTSQTPTPLTRQARLAILGMEYDPSDPPRPATTVKSGGTVLRDVRFWDGPYALAAYDNEPKKESEDPGSGTTYIRLADNGNPNNLHLRAASITVNKIKRNWTYGVDTYGRSNTTITNLSIQGAYAGIRIAKGHYNAVKHCHIQHGLHRIYIQGSLDPPSPIFPHDNEISFNTFKLNMYGYAAPGAYPTDPANWTYDLALKEWYYSFLKYIVGDTNTADVAIKMGYCGANNRIHHNIFECGAEGIFTYLCDNTQIYCNTFRHMSDCGVLASDADQKTYPKLPSGETVQCNQFSDVSQFIRYDSIDMSGGERTNFHYLLSNTGANDPKLGCIVQFHMADYHPSQVGKFALTMAGNRFGLTADVFHFSTYTTAQGGIPKVTISGNSFLSPKTIDQNGFDWLAFARDNTMVGSFVNNRLVDDMKTQPLGQGPAVPPAWYDGNSNTVI